MPEVLVSVRFFAVSVPQPPLMLPAESTRSSVELPRLPKLHPNPNDPPKHVPPPILIDGAVILTVWAEESVLKTTFLVSSPLASSTLMLPADPTPAVARVKVLVLAVCTDVPMPMPPEAFSDRLFALATPAPPTMSPPEAARLRSSLELPMLAPTVIDLAVRLTSWALDGLVDTATRLVFSALASVTLMLPALKPPALVRLSVPVLLVLTPLMPPAALSATFTPFSVPAPPTMSPELALRLTLPVPASSAPPMLIVPAPEIETPPPPDWLIVPVVSAPPLLNVMFPLVVLLAL